MTFLFEVHTSWPLSDTVYQNVFCNDYGRYYVTNQLPLIIYKTKFLLVFLSARHMEQNSTTSQEGVSKSNAS